MAAFLSSAPPGLVSYIVNRWFAPPANFHQPSGLNSARNRSTPAFEVQCAITVIRSPPASRAAPRSRMGGTKKRFISSRTTLGWPKGLTCERRALPRNLARIIELQRWRDCTNIKAILAANGFKTSLRRIQVKKTRLTIFSRFI